MPLPDASQVIIIFQTFAGKQDISPAIFLQLLYDELKKQLNVEKKSETINTYTFENFISTYYSKGKRFVSFFDELDASAENKNFDHAFFSYLRSLSETYDVQYIVASRKSIKQMIQYRFASYANKALWFVPSMMPQSTASSTCLDNYVHMVTTSDCNGVSHKCPLFQ